jgi:hypothetical protein
MSITPFRGLINNTRDNYVYMSTTGDDNNTGEADSPVKSLKRALEIASVNGRGVFVKSGTYNLGDGFGTDPSNRYNYYFSSAGKLYQADQWGNTDLLKSAFCYETPILGEFTLYREFSTGYTFASVADASLSYSTVQISPSPNFGIDELKGKSLIINGYNNLPEYCYKIIKNTADTIYFTSICGTINKISIYDCPTFQLPSGKYAYLVLLGFAMQNLNFEIAGNYNFNVYGSKFYSCYFSASAQKIISVYENSGVKSYFSQCLFSNITLGGGLSSGGDAELYRCAFRGTSPAIYNIGKVTQCSAWECGDFYQLNTTYTLGRVNIFYAGGQDNTGNFININTSGYKSSNAEIILRGSSSANRFTINAKDIQFANGYKTSLDAIPYQLLTRKQAIKLVENEDGLKIWISG